MVHWFSNQHIAFLISGLSLQLGPQLNKQNNTTTTAFLNTKTGNEDSMAEEKKQEVFAPTGGVAAKLARKNILELSPYRCARDDYSNGVLLDANENAIGPTSLPTKCLDPYDNSNTLERYPDPYQMPLKELYAKYRGHNITPANIFVGVGSDEAIDLLMRIFCAPGTDQILITPPTYGMYKVCAKVNDVEIVSVPLTPTFDVRIPEVCYGLCVRRLFLCYESLFGFPCWSLSHSFYLLINAFYLSTSRHWQRRLKGPSYSFFVVQVIQQQKLSH